MATSKIWNLDPRPRPRLFLKNNFGRMNLEGYVEYYGFYGSLLDKLTIYFL